MMLKKLGSSAKKNICESAAMAVCLFMLPFSLADNRLGMIEFGSAVFQAGPVTSLSDKVDIADLFPSAKSVRQAVQELSEKMRSKFQFEILDGFLRTGGGMTCGGLTLKIQDKHFYELTLHYLEVVAPCALTGKQS